MDEHWEGSSSRKLKSDWQERSSELSPVCCSAAWMILCKRQANTHANYLRFVELITWGATSVCVPCVRRDVKGAHPSHTKGTLSYMLDGHGALRPLSQDVLSAVYGSARGGSHPVTAAAALSYTSTKAELMTHLQTPRHNKTCFSAEYLHTRGNILV